jgi:diguanylate cyclase (GGDEF)-like protein
MRPLLAATAVAALGIALERLSIVYGADTALHATYVVVVSALVGWLAHTRQVAVKEADTDGLTGIPNRRAFVHRAEAQLARMRRTGTPLTVVYLDVDRFKQINDQHGHAAGDRVLRCVARTLATTLRGCDLYARLGGDEFVVLLDGGRPHPLIGRLHQNLRRATAARGLDVGFSLGAVTFTTPPASVDVMLKRGDSAMYEAKAGGALVHQVA